MKSSCIQIKIGHRVKRIRDGAIGTVEAMALTPNSIHDQKIICMLKVLTLDGKIEMIGSSDQFQTLEDVIYPEFYPLLFRG